MTSNGHEPNGVEAWRTQPMYTFGEAARLSGVAPATVRNWIRGYTVNDRTVPPLFESSAKDAASVSFLQLIEMVVAARFRKNRITFKRVRAAYDSAKTEWKLAYPFAHRQLGELVEHVAYWLEPEARDKSVRSLGSPEQWSLPGLVMEIVRQLHYDESDLAAKWYPAGKEAPIVIDPRVSAGLPTIAGRGVTVDALRKRWKAGYTIEFIADDFRMKADVVERALQYADAVAA